MGYSDILGLFNGTGSIYTVITIPLFCSELHVPLQPHNRSGYFYRLMYIVHKFRVLVSSYQSVYLDC